MSSGEPRANLVERERAVLRALTELASACGTLESSADAGWRRAEREITERRDEMLAAAENRYRSALGLAESVLATTQRTLAANFERQHEAIERECHDAIDKLTSKIKRDTNKARRAVEETKWMAQATYDAMKKRLGSEFEASRQRLAERRNLALQLEAAAQATVAPLMAEPLAAGETDVPANEATVDRLNEALSAAQAHLHTLQSLRLPRAVQSLGWFGMVFLAALVITPLAGLVSAWQPQPWAIGASVASIVAGLGMYFWLRAVARQQYRAAGEPLVAEVRAAEACCRRLLAAAEAQHDRRKTESREQRDAETTRAKSEAEPILERCRRREEQELPQLTVTAGQRLDELQVRHDADRREAQKTHQETLAAAESRRQSDAAAARSGYTTELDAARLAHRAARDQALRQWQQALTEARNELAAISEAADRACPDWSAIAAPSWRPPECSPPALRFGNLSIVGEAAPPDQGPGDDRGTLASFTLPALVDFPGGSSVYVRASGQGRQRAIELLRLFTLRLLTALPPGKVRLTFVDPVGLGQNFATFMHLADHDEALVASRIWTEPQHIDQRLADLTEHMETIIQKYLREEFASIEEYNLRAGEIAEPFRVLVVANFPAGFTEASARRLLNIAQTGPRCGVLTLVSVDAKLPNLPGIDLAELRRQATVFTIAGDEVTWHDADFKDLRLAIDDLPPSDLCRDILQRVGAAALGMRRVEVPFEAVAPPESDYWASDSRRGIEVPLGRAGATRLQLLRLGQGTSQHVLIAGKTGSGKSTLLHALITNAALRYSPDELELYLIDFKKGVEFKTYVTHRLPHARVVAIESEREFGLSVMQRLDAEMQVRGELFRQHGVQDLGGYRDAGHTLPRILLIVDEFQEFFTEEDKISQEASLLLDRLVRQGRAFGIHVHLGSQTLGGAYSLARSTLGQMAVRIALQCSENDAHLILGEDNTAARLLARPGEAIYNDAGGLLEGNHLFQIVWLADERREAYLTAIQRLLAERPSAPRPRPIVFEGARPASLEDNDEVRELLDGAAAREARAPRLLLGEPLAIEAATSVTVRRRSGGNLLWLGQNDEAVAGMLGAAAASLLAQLTAKDDTAEVDPTLVLLDGSADEASIGATARRLAASLPRRIRHVEAAGAKNILQEFADELARRREAGAAGPTRILAVLDLARLRLLRHTEEEFSFSRSSEAAGPKPDRQFSELLREGPEWGLHVWVWCDTLAGFNRTLQRQALKEFEVRILLQMSGADSSLLIDTPAAAQLGRYRALAFFEDEGRLEKFRPFGPPSEDWLQALARRLLARPAAASVPAEQLG
ncbi:MAG: hypothetical protein K1X74_18480 [Pirellulales bacterium]|nr:hypothetical protein [Pirellulales bacterium]